MIELTGVRGGYGGIDILTGFDMRVERGTISCIVGPNGAGKSTVLKTVSGLLRPKAGSVVIDGTDLAGRSPTEILRAGAAQVPQRNGLFMGLSVKQNVLMGAYVRRRQRARLAARFEELAGLFPMIAERADELAGGLSGGQRRIVEFARAMMLEPTVVLLDEPTLGLDPHSRTIIHDSAKRMNAAGATILMVEQNVRFGLSLADRVTVMSAGRTVLDGTADEVRNHPDLMGLFFGVAAEPAA